MTARSKRLAIISGLVISAAFLYLAFRDLKPEQFWDSIRNVNPALLILAAATYFVAVAVIALRWQFLLRAVALVPLGALTRLVAICYMGNGVYPLRAGEALRIFLLRRNHQVPIASASTTVMIERAFDGIVMLTFIAVSLLFIDIQSAEVEAIVAVASPLFIGAALVFLLLSAKPALLRRGVTILCRFLPAALGARLTHLGQGMSEGLSGLRNPAFLLGAVISSYVTWAIEASVYWIVMFAFGMQMSFAVALLIIGAVNLAGVISASPGQVGIFEFVVSAILIGLAVEPARAASYALVVHLVIWLPTTLVGFVLLLGEGMGWAQIAGARDLERGAPS